MMRVIVVDDEKPAREELTWLLGQCNGVEVVDQLAAADDVLDRLGDDCADVDLCFLDIDMPGLDGVRLAELWRDRDDEETPLVAFVTAYEEHAVDAFSLDAVDYVLKPVRLSRLQQTIRRARRRLGHPDREPVDGVEPDAADAAPLERISVEELGEYRVISVDDILWIEADEGFATVHTGDEDYLTDFSLKSLEENLDDEDFFRCHRSYIVRLDAIRRIAPVGAGTYKLIVGGDTDGDGEEMKEIPLARSRAPELKTRIPWSANVL